MLFDACLFDLFSLALFILVDSPSCAEHFDKAPLFVEVALDYLSNGLSAQVALAALLPKLQRAVVAESRVPALHDNSVCLFIHADAAELLVAGFDTDE